MLKYFSPFLCLLWALPLKSEPAEPSNAIVAAGLPKINIYYNYFNPTFLKESEIRRTTYTGQITQAIDELIKQGIPKLQYSEVIVDVDSGDSIAKVKMALIKESEQNFALKVYPLGATRGFTKGATTGFIHFHYPGVEIYLEGENSALKLDTSFAPNESGEYFSSRTFDSAKLPEIMHKIISELPETTRIEHDLSSKPGEDELRFRFIDRGKEQIRLTVKSNLIPDSFKDYTSLIDSSQKSTNYRMIGPSITIRELIFRLLILVNKDFQTLVKEEFVKRGFQNMN